MAWHPFRNLGLKVAALGARHAAVVHGQRPAGRAHACARAGRVPQRAGGARDDGRPDRHRRPCTCAARDSQISALEPGDVVRVVDLTDARPGQRRRSAADRSGRRAARRRGACRSIPATVTLHARDGRHGDACRSRRRSTASRRRASRSATIDGRSRRRSRSSGPRAGCKRADRPSITERVSIDGATATVDADRQRRRAGRAAAAARAAHACA